MTATKIVVYATEEPEKGKVNKEIIKELTRLFHAKVELANGFASKEKKFLVKKDIQLVEQALKLQT